MNKKWTFPKITVESHFNPSLHEPVVAAYSQDLTSIPVFTLNGDTLTQWRTSFKKPWDSRLKWVSSKEGNSAVCFIHVGNAKTLKEYGFPAILKNFGAAACKLSLSSETKTLYLHWDQIKSALKAVYAISASPRHVEEILLGILISMYRIPKPFAKEDPPTLPESICVLSKTLKASQLQITPLETVATAVFTCRNLANAPVNVCDALYFAKKAEALFQDVPHTTVKIHTEKDIRALDMDLFLSVNQGSDIPPRLVEITYKGPQKNKKIPLRKVALVGKGVTFDTGGYSLKPASSMVDMKFDMSGGATMLAVTYAAALLKLPVHLKTLVPLTDNSVSGKATKPGDVIRSKSGLTVEIENTDAEGRLILADALTYAAEWKPDCIWDAATLTGAVVIALGSPSTGIMGNSDTLVEVAQRASQATGERVWRLPLFPEMHEWMHSDVADLKNIANVREAGSSVGGIFLSKFMPEHIPWLHFDIAATAAHNKSRRFYPESGSSGVMILTLIEMLKILPTVRKLQVSTSSYS
jgi:leucyl aminopeptidase